MEEIIQHIGGYVGIPATISTALFFFIKHLIQKGDELALKHAAEVAALNEEATKLRKAARDAEIAQLKLADQANQDALTRHIQMHQNFEKQILEEVKGIYTRLNPLGEQVNRILGIMEGMQFDKNK